MLITWYGYSCFKIEDKTRDSEVALVIDPFKPEDGHKLPRNLTADIVAVSHDHPRHNFVEAVGGEPFVITGPGEYEVKEMSVIGVRTFHDMVDGKEKGINTTFFVNVGGLHLLHLGDLNHPLDAAHFEDMHDVDVLFVPVGGNGVLNAKQALDIVNLVEPRIIVPMHYRTKGLCGKCDGVEPFLKAIGAGKPEVLPKLKLADKDVPQEEMKVVVLEAA